MRYIKTIWYFLTAFIGICIMGFFGLNGIFGACGFFISLLEHCPGILIGLGMFVSGVIGVVVGWGIFCDGADKLKSN